MVTSIKREIQEDNGTIKTIMITSQDSKKLNLSKRYKLDKQLKENKISKIFKNSILGTEIGIKAEGFTTITILATLIAIASICIMYALFKI